MRGSRRVVTVVAALVMAAGATAASSPEAAVGSAVAVQRSAEAPVVRAAGAEAAEAAECSGAAGSSGVSPAGLIPDRCAACVAELGQELCCLTNWKCCGKAARPAAEEAVAEPRRLREQEPRGTPVRI
ncbi:hypothetical protein [Streptomyces sp. NPDC001933]|uniref:hypothetical protein n=1 Tax=Streptomyces sp. NPDC001933 TaxID=3364626 RepID=UPI0036789C5A